MGRRVPSAGRSAVRARPDGGRRAPDGGPAGGAAGPAPQLPDLIQKDVRRRRELPVALPGDVHVLRVAAVQGEAHQRVGALQLGDRVRHEPHGRRLAAADPYLARQGVRRDEELGFRATDQVHDLLGAPAQAHTRLGQLDPPAAAVEQLAAQLAFQLLHLAGERRLRQVQRMRGPGDGPLAGDHEEVLQGSDLHEGPFMHRGGGRRARGAAGRRAPVRMRNGRGTWPRSRASPRGSPARSAGARPARAPAG